MTSHASTAYLREAVAHRPLDDALLDVVLALFDGHDIPAVRWEQGRRPGYYKAPWLARVLAVRAHLVGAVQVGTYPFRGVSPWRCDCPKNRHTCAGLGARYLCLDLDAHKGEEDTEARVRRVLAAAWRLGILPVVFSSRSGNGAHVYVFFDRALPTTTVHAAGRHLATIAGITTRCDIIPSAQHYKGLGTLHALPLCPLWARNGGGLLFDHGLRPVRREHVVNHLRWALMNRTQAEAIVELAAGHPPAPVGAPAPFVQEHAPEIERTGATLTDDIIFKAMRKRHPQFRKAIATPPDKWKGGRSTRDAYLVSYMRRQKMTPGGIVKAMCALTGTKAAERGPEYAWALVLAQEAHSPPEAVPLAGEPLRPRAAKRQRQEAPWSPWDARVAPPRLYEGFESPWWTEAVQERLRASRGRLDGIVLAHLVDRYYRGPVPRRMFFASRRGMAKRLKVPAGTVGKTMARVAETFPDVLRCVPGVPHPRLRLAAGYYVPEHRHHDALDWYAPPGTRSGRSH